MTVETIYCDRVDNYVLVDMTTCPWPRCLYKNCPLKKSEPQFECESFGHPYSQPEPICDCCPMLVKCIKEFYKDVRP